MMIEILVFSLLGLALGTILGLLPGLHLNNTIPFILLLLPFATSHNLVVLIVSTAIAQVFTGFIPSIYLGAPSDETNSLSVLPGHRLLLEGRGDEAVRLVVISGFLSLLVSIIVVLSLGKYFVILYSITRPFIPYALLSLIFFMMVSEKNLKKIFYTFLIISLSGVFGVIVLNSPIVSHTSTLFPTFTGLFAISTLIASIAEKSKLPQQIIDNELNLYKRTLVKAVALGVIAGILIGLLPAVGVSQGAMLMQYAGGLGESRAFISTLSSLSTANEVVSLNSLYLISNPRSGASVGIERIMPDIGFYDMILFVGVILFTAGLTVPVTIYLSRVIPKFLIRINYTLLSMAIIIFLTAMISLITGFYGLLIGTTATAIGLLCAYLGVKRTSCMGVLLIPSILFFTGLNPLIISILKL